MDDLEFRISAKTEGVSKAFDELDSKIASTQEKTLSAGKGMEATFVAAAKATALLTTAVAAGVTAAVAFWKASADSIDAQNKLANSLGLTYSQYERVAYAADIAGTKQETLNGSLKRLSVNLIEAMAGTGPAAEALKRLNLQAGVLASMPLDSALQLISEALVGVENAADRARIVTNLFGKEGLAMMPLLQSDMKALGQEAEDLGRTLSDADLTGIDNAGDAFDRVEKSIGAVSNRFTADLAPTMEAMMTSIFGVTEGMGEFGGVGSVVADLVTNAMGLLINVWTVLKGGVQFVTAAVMEFGAIAAGVFTGLVATINFFWTPFQKMINGWIMIHNLIFKDEQWKLLGDLDKAVNKSAEFTANLHNASMALANEAVSNVAAGLTGTADDGFHKQVDANRNAAAAAAASQQNILSGEAQGLGGNDKKDKEGKEEKLKSADDWEAELNAYVEKANAEAEIDADRFARKKEMAQDYLGTIQELGMSELELLALQHEEKMAKLGDMRLQELITQEEFNTSMAQLDQKYQQDKIQTLLTGNSALQQVSKAFQQGELSGALSFFAQGLAGLTGHSKKLFDISKMAKLAQAALTLPETVMNAYNAGMMAGGPAGPAVGAAYATVALATQVAQMRSIQSASFGGGGASAGAVSSGGGAMAGGEGASAPAASSGPSRIIELGLIPDDAFVSGGAVNSLMERFAQEINDGGGKALLRAVKI